MRLLVWMIAAVVMMLWSSPTAHAQVALDSAYLEADEAGPPGSVLPGTRIYVTAAAGSSRPYAVSYSFSDSTPGNSPCQSLSSSSGAYRTGTFNLTLPRPGGARTLHVRAWSGSSCTGSSDIGTIPVNVNAPRANAPLLARCGLDVALVLDESASIVSPTNYVSTVRAAARAFVTALFGTGSRLATIAFAKQGRIGVPYDFVNEGSQARFDNWINGQPYTSSTHTSAGYAPANSTAFQGTNWQDAFETVAALNLSRTADLVVFVTDGDPNFINDRSSALSPDGHVQAMRPAWKAANDVKADGSRVFAIGVGPAVSNANSEARLTAVSGNTKFVLPARRRTETQEFARGDYTLVAQFGQLGERLQRIVQEMCSPSVTITKWVSPTGEPASFVNGGPGWQFRANLEVAPGGHAWVTPSAEPENAGSVTADTDVDGKRPFEWEIVDGDARSKLTVQETPRANYQFRNATCRVSRANGDPVDLSSATGVPELDLGPDDYATCSVFNQGPTGTLTVTKRVVPSTDPGRFDLVVNGDEKAQQVGDGGGTGPLTLPAGDHFVSERIADVLRPAASLAQYAVSTTCVDGAVVVASGTGRQAVKVPVAPGADVVCTITNERIGAPPAPTPQPQPQPAPEPQVPPPPCSDFVQPPTSCAGTDPPPVIPQAELTIQKRARSQARVGSRVPVTITVRNTGQATAADVALEETPPGGVRMSAAGATRQRGGTLRFRLGDLAPGERRTVRATMVLTRPGAHRNVALVSAGNAGVAVAGATTRALPPRPVGPPPVVTG